MKLAGQWAARLVLVLAPYSEKENDNGSTNSPNHSASGTAADLYKFPPPDFNDAPLQRRRDANAATGNQPAAVTRRNRSWFRDARSGTAQSQVLSMIVRLMLTCIALAWVGLLVWGCSANPQRISWEVNVPTTEATRPAPTPPTKPNEGS